MTAEGRSVCDRRAQSGMRGKGNSEIFPVPFVFFVSFCSKSFCLGKTLEVQGRAAFCPTGRRAPPVLRSSPATEGESGAPCLSRNFPHRFSFRSRLAFAARLSKLACAHAKFGFPKPGATAGGGDFRRAGLDSRRRRHGQDARHHFSRGSFGGKGRSSRQHPGCHLHQQSRARNAGAGKGSAGPEPFLHQGRKTGASDHLHLSFAGRAHPPPAYRGARLQEELRHLQRVGTTERDQKNPQPYFRPWREGRSGAVWGC